MATYAGCRRAKVPFLASLECPCWHYCIIMVLAVFGGVFYMTTGLHALHVMVGVVFLAFTLVGVYKDLFSTETTQKKNQYGHS